MDIYFDKENFFAFILTILTDKDSSVSYKKQYEIKQEYKIVNDYICEHCIIHLDFSLDPLRVDFTNREEGTKEIEKWFDCISNSLLQDKYALQQLFEAWHKDNGAKHIIDNSSFEDKQLPLERDDISEKLSYFSSLVFCRKIDVEAHQGMIISSNEAIKGIKSVILNRRNMPAKVYNMSKIETWKELIPNVLPCTDIIIADPHIFAEDTNCRNNDKRKNVLALLKHLCSWYENLRNLKVNIVFITHNSYVEWQSIKDSIKKDDLLPNSNVTFVKPSVKILEKGVNEVGQHDRTIFTNYRMYLSGDSFTYFDCKGNNQSQGLWFTEMNTGDQENASIARDFLNRCNSIIENCVKKGSTTGQGNWIYGDMKSNFLDFYNKR